MLTKTKDGIDLQFRVWITPIELRDKKNNEFYKLYA